MELAIDLPPAEVSTQNKRTSLAELRQKANERWWKAQVFLGKNALTKLIAMEGVGTMVDVGLMGAGMYDPLTREPLAALVDLGVLHKLSSAHEAEHPEKYTNQGKLKKLGGTMVMLATVIGAQKAGLAVAEHAGLAHQFDGGVQIGSKWSAFLGANGVNSLKRRLL